MPTPFRALLSSLLIFFAVSAVAQNTAPEASADFYTTDWDTPIVAMAPGVLANDLDAENDALQAHLVQGPERGSLSLEIDGSFTYQTEAGFEGQVRFTYKAWDGMFGSEATVVIDVVAGNLAPIAVADHYVSHGEDLFIDAPGVLQNDRDPENDMLMVWPERGPVNGTFGLAGDGSFYFYPDPGFYGQTTFTYTLFDGLARSQGTVTLSIVEPPNQAPVVLPESFTLPMNASADLDVLDNDYDPDGTELFISRVCCVTPVGSVEVINGGRQVRLNPENGYRGQVELAYFVTDGEAEVGTTITATIGMEFPPDGEGGGSFVSGSSWTGAGTDNRGWHVGDFDGDGRSDIFRYRSGYSGAEVFLSTGSDFALSGSWTGAGDGDHGWYIGDFNGDGMDDIFRYRSGISGAEVLLSNGSGFIHSGSWTGAGTDSRGWHIGDFNGDGRDDIFRYRSGYSGAEVFLSTGSGFALSGSWTGAGDGDHGWYIGDFNGDGMDDIFRYRSGTSGAEVLLSNGSGFTHSGSWTDAGTDGRGWHIGDFNGDGRDDIFRYRSGYSGAEVFLSTGSEFTLSGSWTGAGDGDHGWYLGDFNGDGMDDIFRYISNSSGADVFLSEPD